MITHPLLSRLAGAGVKLGLDRVRGFLQTLGEPHRAYPSIHVAGTNGKGSTCMFVTESLVAAGYRVGTVLSPHVEQVNERIRLDGVPIDDTTLSEGIEALDRARWDWARSASIDGEPLTYYEFVTALAFHQLAAWGVDVAVVEVGMGGRLDATNLIKPQVCAVTSIGMDHTAELGDTLEAIAMEKAGIFERGVPVVLGSLPDQARAAVLAHAKRLNAPVWKTGTELVREQRRGQWSFRTPAGTVGPVTLGLEGVHQGSNGVVAVGILHQLRSQGFWVPDEAIVKGLAQTRLEGRLEDLGRGVLADGAHNPDGARALARHLASRPRDGSRILLLGMGRDRDPVPFVKLLAEHVDEVVTTRCAHPKARESLDLAHALQDLDVLLADGGPIEQALPELVQEADETIVTGSLYVAGAARAVMRELAP